MEKKYDQIQVYRAYMNGANVEYNWVAANDLSFNLKSNNRIANKTADGLNFHDFVDQVKDDCSNVVIV